MMLFTAIWVTPVASAASTALGDRRLEEATARIAAIEAEQRELAGAIDRLCESRGQGSADDQGGPLAAVRHLVDYIAGEEREAEKVEVERDDLRSQADDAHEALSAAGVAAGELPERVEDVIEERDRLDQVPDLLAEVRRLLQRLDAGGVPASRSTPKRAARPRAPPERKPRP